MTPAIDARIVVGVDGSKSSLRALAWAARQAQLTGAIVELITTWEWPRTFGWAVSYTDGWNPQGDAERVQAEAVEAVQQAIPGVKLQSRVVEGHPAPVLIEASRGAELLVVGSRGHGEFAGMLLGSVSEHCVTNAHCPVLVFRDKP
jgi:nucleotide-binding universal stress UspA family protein